MKPKYKLSATVVLVATALISIAFFLSDNDEKSTTENRKEFYDFLSKLVPNDVRQIEVYSLMNDNFFEQIKIYKSKNDIEEYIDLTNHSLPWHPNRPALRQLAGIIIRLNNHNVMVLKCFLKADYDARYEIDKKTVFCRGANPKTYSSFISSSDRIIYIAMFRNKGLYSWFNKNQILDP